MGDTIKAVYITIGIIYGLGFLITLCGMGVCACAMSLLCCDDSGEACDCKFMLISFMNALFWPLVLLQVIIMEYVLPCFGVSTSDSGKHHQDKRPRNNILPSTTIQRGNNDNNSSNNNNNNVNSNNNHTITINTDVSNVKVGNNDKDKEGSWWPFSSFSGAPNDAIVMRKHQELSTISV